MKIYAVKIPKMLHLADGTKKEAGHSIMWVGSEERAQQVASEAPGRSYALVTDESIVPPQALENLKRAAAERAAQVARSN